MVVKYPQDSYAALVCAIQPEWMFLNCVKKYKGYVFAVVEKIIQEIFLPRLFFGKPKYLPSILGTLTTILVNKCGLDLKELVI